MCFVCVGDRKQDQQRRKEYREEMKEIQERVRGRPLLLEQVARVRHTHTHTRIYDIKDEGTERISIFFPVRFI